MFVVWKINRQSQPAESETATAPRHAQADLSRQSDGTVRHKRRGEMSPMYHNSPRKRDRRVRAASHPDDSQMDEVLKRQVELARQKKQAEVVNLCKELEQYKWSARSSPQDQPLAPQRPPMQRQEHPQRSQSSQLRTP